MSATTKIAVHSLADLKNTTDDALPNYLKSLKFRQSNRLTDVRLALGYSAVAIAGALFYFDWKHGWDVSKAYTGPAVAVYFVLNMAFSYWMWGVEKGCVFEGEGRGGIKIRIRTSTKKHDPTYHLSITTFTTSRSSSSSLTSSPETRDVSAAFARWFTADGYFVAKPFQQWLASNVPVIGAADPNNIVEEIGRGNVTEATGSRGVSVDEMLRVVGAAGAASGARGRRRKG